VRKADNLTTVHDEPLYVVRPDLLVAVGETSYGIKVRVHRIHIWPSLVVYLYFR